MIKHYLLLFLLVPMLHATSFSLSQHDNNASDPTLLVIGGIHGNEPGGYFAAALLTQHYRITQGNLWVVPDLNRVSIQANRRGIHGDMNRKFAHCSDNDPDCPNVEAIKEIITDKRISLVLNLHDGHGFYRKNHEGTIFNPSAWGQTCVIDQGTLENNQSFGDMDTIAKQVSEHLNAALLQEHHSFNVKNTQTKFEDEAMRHSLTYFAVTHNKPAFAIETSKHLSSLAQKVFYQLNAIEAFMGIMNIHFERDFALSQNEVNVLLQKLGNVVINDKITLDFTNIRKSLSFVPLESPKNTFTFSHPLGSVKKEGNRYALFIGNRKVTSLRPEYFQHKECASNISFEIDGATKSLPIGSETFVNADFKVKAENHLRVNIIGFTPSGVNNENHHLVTLKDMNPRFSLDKNMRRYRVELYANKSFCGMITVHFK